MNCKYFYEWDNHIPCCKLKDEKNNTRHSKCLGKCKEFKRKGAT